MFFFFFFQAEDGIRDRNVTGVQTCALPISCSGARNSTKPAGRSRAASNSGGVELTATTRLEKGQGASPGFGLLLAVVAIVEVSPFRYEFERKPVDELDRQFKGRPGETSNF